MRFSAEDLQEKGRRVYGAQWRQKVADKLEISKAAIDGYFTKGEMPKPSWIAINHILDEVEKV